MKHLNWKEVLSLSVRKLLNFSSLFAGNSVNIFMVNVKQKNYFHQRDLGWPMGESLEFTWVLEDSSGKWTKAYGDKSASFHLHYLFI